MRDISNIDNPNYQKLSRKKLMAFKKKTLGNPRYVKEPTYYVPAGAVHIFPIAALDLSLDYDHVRRQLTTDQYKCMSLFNASAQYKFKRLVLRLELDNLLNQRHYAYPIFNGITAYTDDYTLCGRTIMMKATFKL